MLYFLLLWLLKPGRENATASGYQIADRGSAQFRDNHGTVILHSASIPSMPTWAEKIGLAQLVRPEEEATTPAIHEKITRLERHVDRVEQEESRAKAQNILEEMEANPPRPPLKGIGMRHSHYTDAWAKVERAKQDASKLGISKEEIEQCVDSTKTMVLGDCKYWVFEKDDAQIWIHQDEKRNFHIMNEQFKAMLELIKSRY